MPIITKSTETITFKDLVGFDLCKGLEEKELTEIARLCRREIYEKNTIIYFPSSSASDVYFLENESDSVQIELPIDKEARKVITHSVRKGEIFGWSAMVPPQLRTTYARCVEKAEVIIINGQELLKLMQKNNHMGFVIMKNLNIVISQRLTCTTIALRHEIRKMIDK